MKALAQRQTSLVPSFWASIGPIEDLLGEKHELGELGEHEENFVVPAIMNSAKIRNSISAMKDPLYS